MTAFDEILPPPDDPALRLIHERNYVVRAYRRDDTTLVIRGAIRDQKPPHLYIAEDDRPLTMHHMILQVDVDISTMQILAAHTEMRTHPNELCPAIEPHYDKLVGLSITRGFTHKVRELFGGPRGCTHVTALLQAMAPAAMQSLWSMEVLRGGEHDGPQRELTAEERVRNIRVNVNTCHMWVEDGELLARTLAGESRQPIPLRQRVAELGHDPDSWQR